MSNLEEIVYKGPKVPIIGQKRGYFIAVEGMDGVGKSTQLDLLEKALSMTGFKVKSIRSPGGSILSEKIRGLVKNKKYDSMTPETELLLMSAAMGQTAQEVIKPALNEGCVVLCDRYHFSTICYQGARGLDYQFIKAVIQFNLKDVLPDITFCLYLDKDEANKRMKARGTTDRFEGASKDYLDKVQEKYDWLRKQESASKGKVIALDAKGSIKGIHTEIYKCTAARISELKDGTLDLAAKIITI